MSADNWTVCPECAKRDPFMGNDETTLREDYEFFMSREGEFSASYRAHCQTCGFSHTFEHKETVPA